MPPCCQDLDPVTKCFDVEGNSLGTIRMATGHQGTLRCVKAALAEIFYVPESSRHYFCIDTKSEFEVREPIK